MERKRRNKKNNETSVLRSLSYLVRTVVSVSLLVLGLYLCSHFMEYQRNASNQVNKYRIDQVAMVTQGSVVQQKFRAKHKHLKNVKVYFGNDYAGTAVGDVILEIVDEETGRSLVKLQEAIRDLVNYDYTEFNTDLQLEKGHDYFIQLTTQDAESGKEPLIFQWATKETGFKGKMTVNGVPQRKYLVAKFYYPVTIYRQWAGIMVSVALLILLLWFPIPLPGRIKEIIGLLMTLAAPYFTFWMVERFTDNLLKSFRPAEFALNILLYYMFFGLLYLVFYSRRFAVTLGIAVWYFIGLANYFVLIFKGAPIVPSDMMSASTGFSVAANYNYTIQPVFIWNAIFALLYCFVIWRCPARKHLGWKPRLAMALAILAASVVLGHFVVEQKTLKSYGIRNNVWDQKKGYAKNGLFFGFVLNMNSLVQEKPSDYSVEAAQTIAEKYEEAFANEKDTGKRGSLQPKKKKKPNVICIMNEAFSDLHVIGDFSTNQDYMPYIHNLKKNVVKGNLYMSIFGSGTCNSEFEFLTGDTMSFLQSGIIAYTQVVRGILPNITYTLQQQGYGPALALHPYLASGWNRPEVYEEMGFTRFFSESDFVNPLMYRKYISDQSDFEKLIELYEQREKKEDPFYLFTVTMQNHGGFDKEYSNFTNDVLITDNHKNDTAEQYLSLVKKSDEAFKLLTDYFKKVDEPTLIVMFGDHQPAIDSSFYDGLFGKSAADLSSEDLMKKYQVPFIIWANYNIEEKEIDRISANYLSAYMMKEAGLTLTSYQKFLLKLMEKMPVLTAMGSIDKDGNFYESALDSPYKDIVKEYQIMQYNNLIDTDNMVKSFFFLKDPEEGSVETAADDNS